jgi:uncharacterized protein (DUF433 family)
MTTPTFNRITQDPSVFDGNPCIRDTGITVSEVVSQLMDGRPIELLLMESDLLDIEDIFQVLMFAVHQLLEGITWAKSEGLQPLTTVLNTGYTLTESLSSAEDREIASLIGPNVEKSIAVLRQLNEWAKATYNAYG